NCILSSLSLLLGDGDLLLGSNVGFRRISSGLSSRDCQYAGLCRHFPKLIPKHYGSSHHHQQRNSGNQKSPSGVTKSSSLKDAKRIILDYPCEQRVVDDRPRHWITLFCLVIAAWIVDRAGID